MIPIVAPEEPADFAGIVENPGNRFLKRVPAPTRKQWEHHAYWCKASGWLRIAYGEVCAYTAHWIAPDTGAPTVDHFIPKTVRPDLAYQWSNLRYACNRLNGRKGVASVLDPVGMQPGVFELVFPSLLVRVRDGLDAELHKAATETIKIFGLNDESTCVSARREWLSQYRSGMCWRKLKSRAPFLAEELRRQNLE